MKTYVHTSAVMTKYPQDRVDIDGRMCIRLYGLKLFPWIITKFKFVRAYVCMAR